MVSAAASAAGALTAGLALAAAALLRTGLAGRRRAVTSARLRPGSRRPGRASLLAGSSRPPLPVGAGRAEAAARAPKAPAWLGSRLEAAAIAVAPEVAFRAWVVTAVLAVATTFAAAGAGAAGLVAALAVGAPWLGWRLLRHRGQAALETALPGAVEAVAAGLRSGSSLRQALGTAATATGGPLGDDLANVVAATERGAGVVAALEQWAARRPLPGVRLAAAALCLGAETGGAAAQAVDGVAATLRQRLATQAEARALATQARVSAVVIAAAPVAFCALSTATDARSAAFLFRTPPGLALLGAGLALDALGALWMARLTRPEP